MDARIAHFSPNLMPYPQFRIRFGGEDLKKKTIYLNFELTLVIIFFLSFAKGACVG